MTEAADIVTQMAFKASQLDLESIATVHLCIL